MKELPKFKTGDLETEYKKFSKEDKTFLDDYCSYCAITAGDRKIRDMKRNVVKFKIVIGKSFNDIDLKDLRDYLLILKKSETSDLSKNDVVVHVKKFLKWKFKDWSERFDELKDMRQIKNPKKIREIDEKIILTKKDIENMMKTETKMYWKAFFITQYEGALRTKEVRFLKWEDINLNEDGDYSSSTMHSTKTKTDRSIVWKEATFYLNKLKEEQENTGNKGVYIFHTVNNINKPIDKATISLWIRKLSKRALGREIWSYVLRHTRGTELQKLVKEGKMSKDTATEMMGHSEKMFDKVYSHMDKNEKKEILKQQIYNFEDLPPEKKLELKEEIDKLSKQVEKLSKANINIQKEFYTELDKRVEAKYNQWKQNDNTGIKKL